MVKHCFKRDADEVRIRKPPQRFKEQEEFLAFPRAEPEGPLGLPSDVKALGYKVRFTDEVFGGYRANVLREDGSAVERGVKLRKFPFAWETSVEDAKNDNVVSLKLSSNAPRVIRFTVYGSGELTPEKVARAVEELSGADKDDRMDAALLFARAAKEGMDMQEAVMPLARCLDHENRGVRVDSAFALGEYAKEGGDITQAEGLLLAALNNADNDTRKASARALAHHYINIEDKARLHVLGNHPMNDVQAVAAAVAGKRSA